MDKHLRDYLNLINKSNMIGGGKKITFVTGNTKKLEELKNILGTNFPFEIDNHKLDLPELQGEPEEVAIEKAKLAAKALNGPILIEDSSLCFNALGGLPGVYIKWFFEKLGNEGLHKLLAGFDDKTAYAQCIFTYCAGPNSEPITFVGQVHGKIVAPTGPTTFGFDPIFLPNGYDITFGQMDKELKNKISHRYNSLMKVKKYFEDNKATIQSDLDSSEAASSSNSSSNTK